MFMTDDEKKGRFSMPNFKQPKAEPKESPQGPPPFSLGPLGNLNQVIKALSKTIRAMADNSIESDKGARICNGLGILRQCLETKKLEELGDRLNKLELDPVATRAIERQMVTISPLPPLIEANGHEPDDDHKAH